MEPKFKRIDYLQCHPKYRVTADSLAKVREMCESSGLSPSQNRPKEILAGDAYDQLLSGNAALISASRPVMNMAFEYFTDKTRLIILCDFRGYIVDLASSTETLLHKVFTTVEVIVQHIMEMGINIMLDMQVQTSIIHRR